MRRLHTALAALLLGLPAILGPAHSADDETEQARKLERLRGQIERMKNELAEDRARHDGLSGELRKIDTDIARSVGRLRRLEADREDKQRRVDELRKEYVGEETRLQRQREQLGRQLVAAYALGREAHLKLLLNQEDPNRLDRMLVYFRYFNDARGEHIRAAMAQLDRLNVIQDSLQAELAELDSVRREQIAEQAVLASARAEREQTLERIEAVIAEKGLQLSRMQGDEAQLQRVLEELRNAIADVPDPRLKQRPFKDSRGRLDWPLNGRLAVSFGQSRGVGDLNWSGLVIESRAGTPVHAVSHGQVVFADWLRGMGLLLIVDHGDGYMTLYGHNEAIYKEAGDWVQAGDVIAAVGASGGRRKPGLYFEIRAAGKPVDPKVWLKPRRG